MTFQHFLWSNWAEKIYLFSETYGETFWGLEMAKKTPPLVCSLQMSLLVGLSALWSKFWYTWSIIPIHRLLQYWKTEYFLFKQWYALACQLCKIYLLSFHCCLNVIWTLNCILTSSIFSKLLTNKLTQTKVGPSLVGSPWPRVLFTDSPWDCGRIK